MPMKIPKGFQRRKSSGNALDEIPAAEPSFKVYARPHSSGKSVDMALGRQNRQKQLPVQRNSFENEDEDLFTVLRPDAVNRGSGGTETSHSTAPYDSGASSTRLSTSSTNPSSVDTRSDKNAQAGVQTANTDAPIPPPHQQRPGGFLRNAGRTFSFGSKTKPPEVSPVPPVPAAKPRFSFSNGRDRAMTTNTISSVSTATPPRLLESDLSLDSGGLDGFGSMFDSIGAKSREPSPIRMVPTENWTSPTGNHLRPSAANVNRAAPPRPILVHPSDQVESSPYSGASETSKDGLMHSPSPANTVVQNSPQTVARKTMATSSRSVASARQIEASEEDNMFSETPSRVRASSRATRQAGPPSSFPSISRFNPSPHLNSTISEMPLQASSRADNDDAALDPALLASAELATRYQENRPTFSSISSSNKVMTPAQFERYKQQQEERHRMNKVFLNHKPEDEDSDDNYDDDDDDDDTERDRQAAQQRRKQEAHLAVYRQTMMKITGEGPAPVPRTNSMLGSQLAATQSTSELSSHLTPLNFDKSPAKSSDEDEDEDVPLGILAAHGFPNKNKPPNQLLSTSSNPNLRGLAQQQAQPSSASVVGESRRSGLPVFARHLPEDPYYGASLVNQSNRESLAIHSSPNLAVPSGASTAHPHHPAGLVGVIAGEERARAMRRGSPSGGFEAAPAMPPHPGMARSQTTGSMPNLLMPGMPGMPGMPYMPGMPPMPQILTPGDHAQIQMSQQMTQMMQMQMQWMQQMQQLMVNQQPNQGMSQPNQMPQVGPAAMPVPRPQSVPLQSHMGQEPRTMSMVNPNMSGWNASLPTLGGVAGSTYAPSIAPSERSNIGLASRYRPVSTVPEPEPGWTKRASTMTSTTFRPFSQLSSALKQPQSNVRKVVASAVDDDDDDEQGWAEMKAKKDQKKKTWKLRKGQNVLQELYNGSS